MKVLEISSIQGEDTVVYYRRNYKAVAKLEFLASQTDVQIAFTIEIDPFGRKLVYIEYPAGTNFDYPVIPVSNSLKEKIISLDNEGSLPI